MLLRFRFLTLGGCKIGTQSMLKIEKFTRPKLPLLAAVSRFHVPRNVLLGTWRRRRAWGNYLSGNAWICTWDESFKVWSSKASQAKYLGWTEKLFLDQIVNCAPATSQKGTRLLHCKQGIRVTREVDLATRGISYSGHMSNSPIGVQSHFKDKGRVMKELLDDRTGGSATGSLLSERPVAPGTARNENCIHQYG